MLTKFILGIILVEAITELLTKSEFFSPVRGYFFNRRARKFFNFLHKLFDCGYCLSVWVGVALSVLYLTGVYGYFNWLFYGLIIHRMSNLLHFIIDRFDRYKKVD